MTSKLFGRQPKKSNADSPAPSGTIQPNADPGRQAPRTPTPGQKPGWYPDVNDIGLMRYWDGFHWTGQAQRVQSTSTDSKIPSTPEVKPLPPVDKGTPPTVDKATTSEIGASGLPHLDTILLPPPAGTIGQPPVVAPNLGSEPAVVAPASPGGTTTESILFAKPAEVDKAEVATLDPRSEEQHAEAGKDETGTAKQETVPVEQELASFEQKPGPAKQGSDVQSTAASAATAQTTEGGTRTTGNEQKEVAVPETPVQPRANDEVSDWADRTEKAIAKARAAGTAEAWEKAAQAASVVSEMAETMRVVADATQTAEQMRQKAQEAARHAQKVADAAASARQAAEKAATAADEAAEKARIAAHAAAEAGETAEQRAKEVSPATESARTAQEAAESAERMAENLEQIVAAARSVNSPEAWSDARGKALARTGGQQDHFAHRDDVPTAPLAEPPGDVSTPSLAEPPSALRPPTSDDPGKELTLPVWAQGVSGSSA
jgi:Protein of unknown function (DUF2510)